MNVTAIRAAAQKMLIDFETTRSIRHNPTKGRAREFVVVEQFLRPYLPARYAVSSGLIVDLSSAESRQQDLMIYDGLGAPVLLDLDSDKILFPESVYATIEVKSSLARRDLADMARKSASVYGMATSVTDTLTLAPGVVVPTHRMPPMCIGFAFESSLALADLPEHMRAIRSEVADAHALALVCVLRDRDGMAGLLVSVEESNLARVTTAPSLASRLAHVPTESPGDALLYCYLILMSHLAACGAITSGPDLFAYARAAGFRAPAHGLTEAETAGARAVVDGRSLSLDDVQETRRIAQQFGHGELDDDATLDLFRRLPELPGAELLRDPRTVCTVDGAPLDLPGPAVFIRALDRRARGASEAGDSALLAMLLRLMSGAYGADLTFQVPGTDGAFGLRVRRPGSADESGRDV